MSTDLPGTARKETKFTFLRCQSHLKPFTGKIDSKTSQKWHKKTNLKQFPFKNRPVGFANRFSRVAKPKGSKGAPILTLFRLQIVMEDSKRFRIASSLTYMRGKLPKFEFFPHHFASDPKRAERTEEFAKKIRPLVPFVVGSPKEAGFGRRDPKEFPHNALIQLSSPLRSICHFKHFTSLF